MSDTQLWMFAALSCGAYLAAGLVSGVRVKLRNPLKRK